ncbi:MAG: LacI family DNA-binding transcriptional regulator [Lachnospiraceae bacterium]|nr:LacI family DNA-binding transcriptional regulator [Lachnospiraceae bacterium]
MDNGKVKTIDDVARELRLSKSTVSRAISGKGRISAEIRQKVLDYIEKSNYRPNPIARGLSESRTFNVGWVVPGDDHMTSLYFYQRCLQGVINTAVKADYDVLITTIGAGDISGLKRITENHKVDGVILGRTLYKDAAIKYLKERKLPFVVVGSTDEAGVIQVDNDHIAACRELASILKMKGVRRVAFIGGDPGLVVTDSRLKGFKEGMTGVRTQIFMECIDNETVRSAVAETVAASADCIVCEDDRICQMVMETLKEMEVEVPSGIKVASFYDSKLLENYKPQITALKYDPLELGVKACETLMDIISGKKVENKRLLGYEVTLKGSTQ